MTILLDGAAHCKLRRRLILLYFSGHSVLFFSPPPPPKKLRGPETSFFGAKIQTLPSSDDGCCMQMRMNFGKSKTTGIITISRLPSYLMVKFSSRAFELGAHKLCILANGPRGCLTKPWNVVEWLSH